MMFLLKLQTSWPYLKTNATFCVLKETYRKMGYTTINKYSAGVNNGVTENLENFLDKYGPKILYNSIIESKRLKLGYKRNNAILLKRKRYDEKIRDNIASMQPVPIFLKNIDSEGDRLKKVVEESSEESPEIKTTTYFPYSNSDLITNQESCDTEVSGDNSNMDYEIRKRYELMKSTKNWMTAYDNYEHDLESTYNENEDWRLNYGTADPKSHISNVPCGGCGALLHCKDTAIPGYIPSEIFKNCGKNGSSNLEAIICQRCYFLKEYNLALQVRVSPDDYSQVLMTIRDKKALVVLMVDLTDFPCSIWPGVADILGPKMPIVIVGNKVDLLPSDGRYFLKRVKNSLLNHVKLSGFGTCNILDVALISAKTGFGVENLITSLHSLWKFKGDVYLVGCTNVGKSSLFNVLLQSDYCKVQAADLVQRATTSQWPGTTLNLLKFPIMRPSGYRQYLREQRLQTLKQVAAQEKRIRGERLKETNSMEYATLIGHMGRTHAVSSGEEVELQDCFATRGTANASGKFKFGINERDPEFALSRWCFDTPGVVQPDQILHLLTSDELVDTLPRHLIRPETFCVRPGTSLFIAGLARLDYLEGPASIRLTVFRANSLPLTICRIEESELIYGDWVGTEFLKVPAGDADRLAKWPGLSPSKTFSITGTDWNVSSNDVVLSSAGWVAINCAPDKEFKFQAWTPEKRGIHIRESILPNAVALRGARIRHSVAYKSHRFSSD